MGKTISLGGLAFAPVSIIAVVAFIVTAIIESRPTKEVSFNTLRSRAGHSARPLAQQTPCPALEALAHWRRLR